MRAIVLLLIIAIWGFSCKKSEPECFAPRSVSAQIGFMVIDTVVGVDSFNRPDTTIRIADTGLYYPTLISLEQDTNIVFMGERAADRLPCFLNPATPSISYVFQPNRDNAQKDTITISYEPYEHFISNACGYTYYYNIKDVQYTRNILDSVLINDANVRSAAQQRHLIFYFID